MKFLTISSSSFLIPKNKVWNNLSKENHVNFGDYGDWSRTLLNSNNDENVALVLFLDDFLSSTNSSVYQGKKLLKPVLDFLENRLRNKEAFTYVGFSSYDDSDVIKTSKKLSTKTYLHFWFLKQLEKLSVNYHQLYIIDLDKEFSKVGFENIFDSRNWYFAHCRLSNIGLSVISDSLEKLMNRINNPPAKVLLLDCDNTIWGGVVGEEGLENLTLGQDGLGQAFTDFQKEARNLSSQGVILCLVSKNNEDDVWEVFNKHSSMVLKREDIVAWKINWNEKEKNISLLSEELDLGLESFVFWDDNPMERDRVRKSLPEVHTVDVKDNVFDWPKQIRDLELFSRTLVTKEDLKKTRQYKSRANFVRERKEVINETEYLKSIDLRPTRHSINDTNISRAAQMCLKTNQFNLRTIRHTEKELKKIISVNQDFCFLTHLEDAYGDHGLVGLVCLKELQKEFLFIDTFLISCRVLGRHLEAWMIHQTITTAQNNNFKYLVGQFVETEKNIVAKDFFNLHGFQEIDESRREYVELFNGNSFANQEGLYIANLKDSNVPFLEIYDDC